MTSATPSYKPTITTASGASWQEVSADRIAHRNATISLLSPPLPELPAELPLNVTGIPAQILSADEIAITESPVEVLLPKLASGELSAESVAKAFLRRAGLAGKLVNCITELLNEKALTRARYLDAYLAEHGKPIGPLHGLPISVKEHLTFKDLDINAGFVGWVGNIGKEDSHILQILERAGAVFYVRTTQPQSLMHLETSNNIYGVTVNPYNATLTSGGSSGGEGTLIGLKGSPLGIGTDIGGSIRSPAANNGVYGFKPTSYRLPTGGWAATMDGAEQIVPCIGPLSNSVEGLKVFLQTLIAAKPWLREPSLLPFEWKDQSGLWKQGGEKLRIGVIWDDGVVRVHPPIARGLKELVEKLKDSGRAEVSEWTPYKHDDAWSIIANLYFSDGGKQECEAIEESGEPYRPLTDFIIKENPHVEEHTATSLWAASARRNEYRAEYAEHWNKTATGLGPNGEPVGTVDIILCPATPSAAPKIDTSKYWGYTAQWNLLDYPAAIFPVGQVEAEKDDVKEKYEPRNEKDEHNWSLWEQYGAEGWKDAPISLQLVGRRYDDEKVIRALEVIKEIAGI